MTATNLRSLAKRHRSNPGQRREIEALISALHAWDRFMWGRSLTGEQVLMCRTTDAERKARHGADRRNPKMKPIAEEYHPDMIAIAGGFSPEGRKSHDDCVAAYRRRAA